MTNEEYDDWEARNMGYRDAKHMREHNEKKDKERAIKYGWRICYNTAS